MILPDVIYSLSAFDNNRYSDVDTVTMFAEAVRKDRTRWRLSSNGEKKNEVTDAKTRLDSFLAIDNGRQCYQFLIINSVSSATVVLVSWDKN